MSRRREDLQRIEISAWPTVDPGALTPEQRQDFLKRKRAIELFVAGSAVREAEARSGVNRHQLYWLLDRCLAPHEDGRVFGFRGLLKHRRVRSYERTLPARAVERTTGSGLVGAFALLLQRNPSLKDWIGKQFRDRAVRVRQVSTEDGVRTRIHGLRRFHWRFIEQCRMLTLTAADYPFNTDHLGIRSLSEYVKTELLREFGAAARAAGAGRPKGMPRWVDGDGAPAAVRPYQVVEFDGHRLDVRLKLVIRDPLGFEQEFEVERVWLLVILDVCTRAVLGYNVVLEREYSRYDVIKTIERALEPHCPRTFRLPGLGYGAAGGFPSGKLPELGYACWQWMKLDRAKANFANDTLAALCEFLGCFVDGGRPHQPDERPYIERFFGTIATTLSSRLPGYTGSHPGDIRRALADPKSGLRLFLSIDELEELMEAAIAAYNATPHSGLNGRSPLEAMEYFMRGKGAMIQWLPEAKRRTLCLMQSAHRCRVRGYLPQGIRPHINLFQVRYTSPALAGTGALLGQELRVYYNSEDLRTVRAFLADGSELGVLKAQGAWGEVRHDLKLRREIMKLRARKRLSAAISEDVIEQYLESTKAKAKRSRRAATELARAVRVLSKAPITATPAPAPVSSASPAAVDESAERAAQKKIKPVKLSIGTGFASGSDFGS